MAVYNVQMKIPGHVNYLLLVKNTNTVLGLIGKWMDITLDPNFGCGVGVLYGKIKHRGRQFGFRVLIAIFPPLTWGT